MDTLTKCACIYNLIDLKPIKPIQSVHLLIESVKVSDCARHSVRTQAVGLVLANLVDPLIMGM